MSKKTNALATRPGYGVGRAMPAARKPPAKHDDPARVLLLLPREDLARLDAWLEHLNDGRWPKLSRLELLRSIVGRAAREKWGAPK